MFEKLFGKTGYGFEKVPPEERERLTVLYVAKHANLGLQDEALACGPVADDGLRKFVEAYRLVNSGRLWSKRFEVFVGIKDDGMVELKVYGEKRPVQVASDGIENILGVKRESLDAALGNQGVDYAVLKQALANAEEKHKLPDEVKPKLQLMLTAVYERRAFDGLLRKEYDQRKQKEADEKKKKEDEEKNKAEEAKKKQEAEEKKSAAAKKKEAEDKRKEREKRLIEGKQRRAEEAKRNEAALSSGAPQPYVPAPSEVACVTEPYVKKPENPSKSDAETPDEENLPQ